MSNGMRGFSIFCHDLRLSLTQSWSAIRIEILGEWRVTDVCRTNSSLAFNLRNLLQLSLFLIASNGWLLLSRFLASKSIDLLGFDLQDFTLGYWARWLVNYLLILFGTLIFLLFLNESYYLLTTAWNRFMIVGCLLYLYRVGFWLRIILHEFGLVCLSLVTVILTKVLVHVLSTDVIRDSPSTLNIRLHLLRWYILLLLELIGWLTLILLLQLLWHHLHLLPILHFGSCIWLLMLLLLLLLKECLLLVAGYLGTSHFFAVTWCCPLIASLMNEAWLLKVTTSVDAMVHHGLCNRIFVIHLDCAA